LMKYGNMKGKLLGFATRDQMVGMYKGEDDEAEEAIKEYEKTRYESEVKNKVKGMYGVEWDDYVELLK